MQCFKDNEGREWSIVVTVATIKRIRDLVQVDLLELLEGQLIDRLIRDPVLLCDVIYAACKPDADRRGLTDEDFGAAMAGDPIEYATKALLDEFVNFCPSPKDRANLKRVVETTWRVMDQARDLVEKKLNNGDLDQIVSQALESAGVISGNQRESQESTQPT